MKIKDIKNEEGFWSAFVLLFLVTLALMGMGASVLIQSEDENTANQVSSIRADFAANGAAYYGIKQLELGSLTTAQVINIEGVSVNLDTSIVQGTSDVLLTVMASLDGVDRGIEVLLAPGKGLVDLAIYTTGHVFNVSGKDSLGNTDPDMVVTQAESVPTIDEAALTAMSTAQGHDQFDAVFKPADGYPNGSFYQADGVTPNVTHVMNDFQVLGGRTVYGIFVVEGDVTLNGNSRIEGVIYLPNPTSTIIHGGGDPSESTITGGLVSHGDIWGTGNHISVQHWPEFMREFCKYQTGPDQSTVIISWIYI